MGGDHIPDLLRPSLVVRLYVLYAAVEFLDLAHFVNLTFMGVFVE